MAIIQGLPGVEVTIYTNSGTAKEYNDPSRAERLQRRPQVVTKYIECGDDEQFGIHLKATGEYSWGLKNHVLNFVAVIDGFWAKSEFCRQEDVKEKGWKGDISYRVAKNPNGGTVHIVQGFAFSKLTQVDRRQTKQHYIETKGMGRLGTIEIRVYRMMLEKGDGAFLIPIDQSDLVVFQEATKGKGQTHRTKFINSQPATTPTYIKSSRLSEDDGPIAIFQFKYRSREALSLKGITPDRRNNNENDDSQQCDSRPNQRNPPSGGRQPKAKTEKEGRHNADNIRPLPNPIASHDKNVKSAPPPRLQRSTFPNSQPSRSRAKQPARDQNDAQAKRRKEKKMKNSCRVTDEEAKQLVDDLIRTMYTNHPARFAAIKSESDDEDLSTITMGSDSEDDDSPPGMNLVGSRNKPFSIIGEDGNAYKPHKFSGVRVSGNLDEDDAASVQEIDTPRTSWSSDTILPSIEEDDHVPRIGATMKRLRGLGQKFYRALSGARKATQPHHHPIGNNPAPAAAATGANSDKGAVAKRKLGETTEGPRPFKISKTRDRREIIDLVDSD